MFFMLLYCFDVKCELAHQVKETQQAQYPWYISKFKGVYQKDIKSRSL